MSVAQLGFQIDSSQAAEAASDLDKLTSSAARAEQAAQKTGAAGTRMSRGFADLNPALEKIIGSLDRLQATASSIDKRLDSMSSSATRAAKANQVLDKSAIEASTSYKQLEASLNAVTAAQRKGDASLNTSLASIEKQREAIARLNAELQKLRSAPPAVPNSPRPAGRSNGGQGNVGNIAAQFFDIGTTAAFMNPATVAIQQGPQLAQAFAGQSTKQALTSLAAGLGAIVSPLSLAAIGLTAGAAAAIQFGISLATAGDESKNLDKALERHDGVLKKLEDRYGTLIEKAKGYNAESGRVLNFESGADQRALKLATKAASDDFFSSVGTETRGGYVADAGVFTAKFRPFNDAVTKLRNEFKAGRPDFEAFYDSLDKTSSLNPGYVKKADELAKLVEQFRQGSEAAAELGRIQREIFNDRGPGNMLLSQGPSANADRGSLSLWESQQRVAAQRRQQSFDAQAMGVSARSPQERAAAARAQASAQHNGDETGTERRVRIEQAGAMVLLQAERQLADAQRDRSQNLDKLIADQEQEITVTGRTAGSVIALRKQYELTSALRMEAARQGIEVDEKEIDLIKRKTTELGHLIDAQTLMMSRTVAAATMQQYQTDSTDQAFYRDRRFKADVAGIGARSPSELAAAERRRLEAEAVEPGKESQANRTTRIDQQVELVQRRAQQQLADAQRDRRSNLDKILQDQQQEIDLVGKTGGAAAALRKEYELTSALRMEAARQGIDVDQKELDLIHQRAAALGELTDKYNQSRFNFEMGQQSADARMSPRDRQITSTLRQYGLPEDLKGSNAQRIGQQLDWQDAKDMAKGFGSAFGNELISGSHDLGKALLKGLQSTLENEASKLWEKFFDGVGNIFADWLTGSKGSGASSGGAISSVVSAITGKSANDNSAGGFSGLGKVIPVTRAPLGDISASGDIASYIAKAASQRGIDPNVALAVAKSEGGLKSWNMQSGVFKNGVQEPSFGPFQLYKGGGLGNAFMSKTGMDPANAASGPAGVDFALDYAKQNGWGSWYGAKNTGISKWQGIGQGGGADTASDAVNKLAAASKDATVNLGGFGNGLGKLGQSLSTSFFPAAPSAPSGGSSGGGLFGWLGGLFSPNFSAMGGQAALAASGRFTGMYADGTNYAPGGMAIVGERGPELVNLPQGSQVFNTNKSAQMMGGAANQNGSSGRPELHVHVYGGSGDNHIRELSRQGAQEAIYQYDQGQVRGGIIDNQQKATARKG